MKLNDEPAFSDSRDSLVPWNEEDWIGHWLVFGTRVYGTVDALPNRFCVGTYFWHLFWLPIVPIGTWLFVFDDEYPNLRNVPLKLNIRSVAVGWLTYAKWFAVIAFAVFFIGAFAERQPGFALIGLILAISSWFGIRSVCDLLESPTPHRLLHLAELANYPKDDRHQIVTQIEPQQADDPVLQRTNCASCGREIPRTMPACPRCGTRRHL